MAIKLKKLAKLVNGEIIGDRELEISGVGGVENVQHGEITFADNETYLQKAEETAATAVIVDQEFASEKTLLKTTNPRLAFAQIADEFAPNLFETKQIHPTAVIADDVKLGSDVSIGPQVVIESGSQIGTQTKIAAGTYVGAEVEIGANTLLHPNVVVESKSQIGSEVIIQAGSVIGSDGYGFEDTGEEFFKVPQLGNVVIEDAVELGANVTIDRGTTGSTVIGQGTKTDNLIHIAHNVQIGENCLLIAQVGIAGSAQIGSGVTLAGKVGVVGHLEIGANTTVAAHSVVTKDIPAESFYSGDPAQKHSEELKVKAARRKLPKLVKKVRKLEEEIEELEAKLEEAK
ncbi:MAG: UDP-3-O-(3-hydroxymyristoyl)glucosamine N-acyltransferase [Bacillota bacterium]